MDIRRASATAVSPAIKTRDNDIITVDANRLIKRGFDAPKQDYCFDAKVLFFKRGVK
jgi:hypothetical protein